MSVLNVSVCVCVCSGKMCVYVHVCWDPLLISNVAFAFALLQFYEHICVLGLCETDAICPKMML